MKPSLNLSELNTMMDIAFLFQSVRDLNLMSQKFLQMLGKVVPYEKAAVFLYQASRRTFSVCGEVRCGGAMVQDYIDSASPMDYLGWQLLHSDRKVFRDRDGVPPDKVRQTKFYQAFLAKHNVAYRLLLSARSSQGEFLGMVMLFRSQLFEDFSDQEAAILEMLYNHFSAGIENALGYEEMTLRESLAQEVYRAIPEVMLILDDQLVLQKRNQAAEEYLDRLATSPAQYQAFFRPIRVCCREMLEDCRADPAEPVGLRQIPLPEGTARIARIAPHRRPGQGRPAFVVVFSKAPPDPEAAPAQPDPTRWREQFFEVLGRQYSLTRRERHLIQLALEGLENQQIAQTLHISLFTVKSHFQNSYAKLGIKSRQELYFVYMQYLISQQFRQEFDAQTRKDDYL